MNVKSYTHKVSPAWLSKHKTRKDSNTYAETSTLSKNHKQFRNAESGRDSLPGKSPPTGYPIPNGLPLSLKHSIWHMLPGLTKCTVRKHTHTHLANIAWDLFALKMVFPWRINLSESGSFPWEHKTNAWILKAVRNSKYSNWDFPYETCKIQNVKTKDNPATVPCVWQWKGTVSL